MARTSTPPSVPGIIPATPPRASLYDSDLDELGDERIPGTSPYITQPTQIVSNPNPKLLRKASPRPSSPEPILSSSPPPQLTKQNSNSCSSGLPIRNQPITKFFSRPLPISPQRPALTAGSSQKMAGGNATRPTIPQKRNSDIIALSSDDDEDSVVEDRADIKPTLFSRKVVSLPSLRYPFSRFPSIRSPVRHPHTC